MKAPNTLSKNLKRLWREVFDYFETENAGEVRMAMRYVEWLELYEASRAIVAVEGVTQAQNNGGNVGQSRHFTACKVCEVEMRALWEKLGPLTAKPEKPQSSPDVPKKFAGL